MSHGAKHLKNLNKKGNNFYVHKMIIPKIFTGQEKKNRESLKREIATGMLILSEIFLVRNHTSF